MLRPRKLIKPLNLDDTVAKVLKSLKVLSLGARIARNVDDFGGLSGGNFRNSFRIDALAGRVEDDDVGPVGGLGEAVELVKDVVTDELGVGDLVEGGGLDGLLDGLFVDFDADDPLGLLGHDLGDGAGAGVEVVDGLAGEVAGHVDGPLIEVFRAGDVGLEEGEGADLEGEAAHLLGDFLIAEEEVDLLGDDGIGDGVVGGVVDGLDLVVKFEGHAIVHKPLQALGTELVS